MDQNSTRAIFVVYIDLESRHTTVLDNQALKEIAHEQLEQQREAERARTAPSARERRRNWNMESVEIKTTRGNKRVKAPGIK